ncbi:hypothetical protein Ocin01_01981 [Orchesella cincta]|uniref:Zinc finger C3HC4 RING-type domain-containing protein n=1 Tax=Orchesella cincta TaxID=48709 RepID=A0A1D2NHH3_ORCCI|nr:hypothetical protein Ocin01_01981 [Orchesella cincta]
MPRYQRGRLRAGSTGWNVQRRGTSSTASNDTESSSSSSSSSDSDSSSSSSQRSCSSQSSRNSSASAASRNNSDSDHTNQRTSDNEHARNSANSDNSNDSRNSDFGINSDAESNATNRQRGSDSPDSDRSQRYRISRASTSNSSSDSSNGSSPTSPVVSPVSSNHSFLGSYRLANSDEDTSFRPLRLPLPESPNPSVISNDSHRSEISQPSSRGHRITNFFFGVPHRLRGRGRSRPSTQNIDLPTNSLDEYPHPHILRNWDHTSPTWTSLSSPVMTVHPHPLRGTLMQVVQVVCLESLDAPASTELGVNQAPAEGQAAPPANNGIPVPGSSRGSRANPRGRKAQPLLHNLCLTDVVTTHCGHLYHRVCLEKWFSEQGLKIAITYFFLLYVCIVRKRTCPSCRKATPVSKVIRLFPSISADATSQVRTGNEAGPSSAAIPVIPVPNNVPNGGAAAAVVPVSQPRGSAASRACDNQQCQDAKVIHNTLINDYNDLQRRFDNLHEDDQIKEAQIRSLEEDNMKKNEEVLTLKRELEEVRAERGSVSVGSKRRRH